MLACLPYLHTDAEPQDSHDQYVAHESVCCTQHLIYQKAVALGQEMSWNFVRIDTLHASRWSCCDRLMQSLLYAMKRMGAAAMSLLRSYQQARATIC